MKQYLLSVHGPEWDETTHGYPSQEDLEQAFRDVEAFNQKLREQGQWVFGGGLHTASTATVVRFENGRTITTDGPYLESKEHIGGFWVIAAPDLDAALKLAAEASEACKGPVEVRPFQDDTDGQPQGPKD